MTVIRQWSGDGLTAGALTTSSAGTGDSAFTSVTGDVTIVSNGVRSPQIRLGDASEIKRFGWWPVHTSDLQDYAVRIYLTIGAHPSAEVYVANALKEGLGIWSIRITPDGFLRLRDDDSATVRWTSTSAVPINEPIRLEIVVAAGMATLRAYRGDTMTELLSGSGTVGALADEVRFGFSSAVASNTFRYDDIAVGTGAALIGPAAAPPPPYTHFRLIGGEWVPQTVTLL